MISKALFVIATVLSSLSVLAEGEQVRVTLTSQPAGATVIVDGMDRGTTPLTLFDIAPGRHQVKFRLAGYIERVRYIDTAESPFVEKNEVMVEEKGLLLLKSEPAGANIFIDGMSAGITPKLITNLAAKDTYSVKLRKAGYQEQSLVVKFEGRKPLVREETLVLASGKINLMSEPSGAEVSVNGIVRGKTPITVSDVPRGRAVVKFSLEGFSEEVRELAINAGDVQTLPVVMKGLPGTLHLTSVPNTARFYINDESRGRAPLVVSGLKPGEYTVRAELEGYGTMTKTVVISNGSSAREEFRLSNVMGRLEVRTDPPGAQVMIDGRPVGITKSNDPNATVSDALPIENLMEGEHVLVIRRDGFNEVTRHPKIQQSKTTTANVRLKRIFIPDVEIVTSRGSYRGVLVSKTADSVTLEVSLGIMRSFPVDEIRKMTFLNSEK